MGDHRTADPAGAAQAERRTAPVGRSCGADRDPVRAAHGHPLGASAGGDGLRLGDDLLAASARVASGWGVGAAASRAARPARLCQRHQLGSCGGGQRQRSSKKGGEETGPNPTDRGKPGSKRHILVDANGIPLALKISPANRHDSKLLETLVDAVPAIRQCAGRPRRRPAKLHADKGYDFAHCRRALRQRAIIPRIARRGVESSERLGRHRWVVERTLAWFARFRRIAVRYERRADIFTAFHHIAASLICWRFVQRWFC